MGWAVQLDFFHASTLGLHLIHVTLRAGNGDVLWVFSLGHVKLLNV